VKELSHGATVPQGSSICNWSSFLAEARSSADLRFASSAADAGDNGCGEVLPDACAVAEPGGLTGEPLGPNAAVKSNSSPA
jgi:hypothetical protein